VLQTRPRRLERSVLVVDASHPFGAGACPPAGDLRGPFHELARLCNEAVVVQDALSPQPVEPGLGYGVGLVREATVDISWIAWGEDRMSVGSVAGRRVGLLTFLARPDRILSSLLLRGIRPVCAWQGGDHESPSGLQLEEISDIAAKNGLEGWIVTTKCVTHLDPKKTGAPLFVLEVTTRLDPTPRPVLDSPPCVPQDSSSSC
jgi:tetraacyldisaccharide-1-P 4'-kinase